MSWCYLDPVEFELLQDLAGGDPNDERLLDFFDGAVLSSLNVSAVEDGGLVYAQINSGDFTIRFSDGYYYYDATPATTVGKGRVQLTAGTDTTPVLNYVYILQSNKTLTAGSDWPDAEHAPIGTFLIQTASSLATQGAYKVHLWTDHVAGDDGEGHLDHLNYWIRQQNATWVEGTQLTATGDAGGGVFDVAITSGKVLQLHEQEMPAIDTAAGDLVFMINDFSTPYKAVGDLVGQLTDAEGNSMSASYYNLVFWGSCSENQDGVPDATDSKLMCNLPTGSYSTEAPALLDDEATAVYSIPSEFRGVGFLIARVTVRHQTKNGGTYTISQTEDLRGLFPSAAAGGAGLGNIVVQDGTTTVNPTNTLDFGSTASAVASPLVVTDDGGAVASIDYNTQADQTITGNRTYTTGSAVDASGADSVQIRTDTDTSALSAGEGEVAIDTDDTTNGWAHATLKFRGTSATVLQCLSMPAADAVTPTLGDVPAYNSTDDQLVYEPRNRYSTIVTSPASETLIANTVNGLPASTDQGDQLTLAEGTGILIDGVAMTDTVTFAVDESTAFNWTGVHRWTDQVDIGDELTFDALVTSTGSNQNDVNTLGNSLLVYNPTADIDFTGISATENERMVFVQNRSTAFTITVKDNDIGSLAANRIATPGGTDLALGPGSGMVVVYNNVLWRVVATSAAGGGGLSDAYATVATDSGSVTASGSDTVDIAGGTGITTAGTSSPDTVTVNFDASGLTDVTLASADYLVIEDATDNSSKKCNVTDLQEQVLATTVHETMSADVDNYNWGGERHVYFNPNGSDRTITGFDNGYDGAEFVLTHDGSANLIHISNQSTSSDTENRTITGTGNDGTLTPDESKRVIYDGTASRWRIVG